MTTTHACVEGWAFCRLVTGANPRAGVDCYRRAEVTCPECLVCLDIFEEKGFKPKLSPWLWVRRSGRGEKRMRYGRTLRSLQTRASWLGEPYATEFPWRRGSVAALAKHHGLREGFLQRLGTSPGKLGVSHE